MLNLLDLKAKCKSCLKLKAFTGIINEMTFARPESVPFHINFLGFEAAMHSHSFLLEECPHCFKNVAF